MIKILRCEMDEVVSLKTVLVSTDFCMLETVLMTTTYVIKFW
jgi:hypothetical protein